MWVAVSPVIVIGVDMNFTTSPIASESGHFYHKDGTPCYQVTGKNGKTRNTTLRDARTMDLVCSVTTITKLMAAPGLAEWIINNNIDAALTLPRLDGESADDFKVRVKKDAKEQSLKAMELGSQIHASLEKAYLGQPFDTEHKTYVAATMHSISAMFGEQQWIAEKSFASQDGYGGKSDLISINGKLVLDFKTKDFTSDKLPEIYDEHAMQLSAYANGFGIPDATCAIVFVSTREQGLVHIVTLPKEEVERGWGMFLCMLECWKIKNRYRP